MANTRIKFKNIFLILFCISLFLFVVIFSVKIVLNFKALYYFDIKYLNIEKYTTLSKEEIKSLYDYLVYYVNSTNPIEFKPQLLPFSKEGITHFLEVKNLFIRLNTILFICTILIICSICYGCKYKDFSFLKWCSNLLLSICLLIIGAFTINFDKCFTFMHKLLFNNNYWLLDPKTDPVINILPEEYFYHCALSMLFIIILCSILLRIIYYKIKSDK